MSVADSASPSPRRGRKASSEGSSRWAISSRRRLAAPSSSRRYASRPESRRALALLGRDRVLEQVVDRRQGVRDGLLARSLDQPGELDQLQEAGDRAGDVDVGVEPRLAQLAAGAPGLLEHLVLDHPVGRLQPLGRAEELLAVLLLRGVEHRPRVLVERRRAGVPGLGRGGPGEHQLVPWPASSPRRAAAAPRLRAMGVAPPTPVGTAGGPGGRGARARRRRAARRRRRARTRAPWCAPAASPRTASAIGSFVLARPGRRTPASETATR